eukprot:Blabericola_migrator_1__150@NODE_103_length_14287_cov_84_885584_g91_i0_p4_GENE_NODE_103_length_14287_cov_84_885584_g91_i0NODE_103_length_14287_cov_84_885584_g91_i0_p4_ORF_typecomplete_len460_score81_97PseudoU_synth_2/PF00849_22/1_7e22_NODE_103_length_14287_cov_84_885584_g91_i021293508
MDALLLLFPPCETGNDLGKLGFRTSGPRHRQFTQSCKNRWKGKTLIDCFSEEYSCRPWQYYAAMIESGLLRAVTFGASQEVKRRRLDPTVPLTGKESIIHESVMSEAVVPAVPLKIVYKAHDLSYVIVDKPSGIPCYPQGSFESNTVQTLLELELKKQYEGRSFNCHFVSRLDRVTGGLVAVAFNGTTCSKLVKEMATWQKAYIMEVRGDFRDIKSESYATEISLDDRTRAIVCTAPLEKLQHEPGTALKVRVDETLGKESTSIFVGVDCSAEQSLVLGFPITGRTHQLRCHAQYLGHSIRGDNLYDDVCLKDTKVHDEYIVIEYTKAESQKILATSPAVTERLDVLSEVEQLKELVWPESPHPTHVSRVFMGTGDLLQRQTHVFPDLAVDETRQTVFSFHPYVNPWRIPLHACLYAREGDDSWSITTVETLPSFAAGRVTVDTLVTIALKVQALDQYK